MEDPGRQSSGTGLEVAVVGLSGRFPGAPDLETFWRNLAGGVESIAFFADDEDVPAPFGPAYGVLDGVELFDADYFGYNPREAEIMDPQHRIFLELAVEALERAGHAGGGGEVVGVYAGASENSYVLSNLAGRADLFDQVGGVQALTGVSRDFLATRISYKLDLRGPSFTVQAACSTSLVAVHLACQALLAGECDVALAGGVAVRVPQRAAAAGEDGIFSPDGHCRAFDAAARGTVEGNGAGVVVLRRLADALADGDPVQAVIKGSVLNNDGSLKAGFTAPSVDGQAAAIRTAHLVAEVEPETVNYVETHGTATPVGDPIEVAALTRGFGVESPEEPFCALGSVKTNIGHLDAAAGVASLIKTVLALQHRLIPPSLHYEKPNPQIDFAGGPFFVNAALRPWPEASPGMPRRAGVSAFGIGGTNAHAILEQAPARPPSGPSRPRQLLALSAHTESALETLTDNLAEHLDRHPELDAADVAYTLQVGRWPLRHRRVLVGSGLADAAEALAARDPKRLLESRVDDDEREVFFLFSGLGEQYPGMGRELYGAEPTFRRAVDRCCELLEPRLGTDLREVLYPPEKDEPPAAAAPIDLRALRRGGGEPGEGRLLRTEFAQPAVFVIGHALTQLWREWGVQPEGAIGYSLGEYLAAWTAGVFSLEDALFLVAERARLIAELPAGRMLAVPLGEDELSPLLGEELSLAAVNAPSLAVAAGPPEAVADLRGLLAQRGVTSQLLATHHAFHSRMMEPIAARFREAVARVPLTPPRMPFVSNVTGTWIRPEEAVDPDYWVRHLCQTLRFSEGVGELLKRPRSALLEIGPGQTLGTFVRQHAAADGGRMTASSLPTAGEAGSETAHLLRSLGLLWLSGTAVDWAALHRHERRCRVALPTYPFERRRYWIEPAAAVPPVPGEERAAAPERPAGPAAEPSPAAAHQRPRLATPFVAPQSALEAAIAGIWHEVLGLAQVGVHDDFFELGGHSLLATRVLSRLREVLAVELSLGQFFAGRTVAELARAVTEQRGSEPAEAAAASRIPRAEARRIPGGERAYEVSFSQERLWFLDQLAPGSASYNVPAAVGLKGDLDVEALRRAVEEVTRRHEVLRAHFVSQQDEVRQVVTAPAAWRLPVVDLGRLDARRQAVARRLAHQDAVRPFDLARGPLLRTTLLDLGRQEQVLLINVHHIACDAESFAILLRETMALYAGRPYPVAEFPVQYADYAAWQRRRLRQGDELASQLAYWQDRLAELPVLDLPTDRPRPAVQRLRGDSRSLAFAPALCAAAGRLHERHGATRFMLLLAAFKALLARFTGQSDVVVGTAVGNRPHRDLEELIGLFVNMLVLRTDLTAGRPAVDSTFEQVLSRVRDTALAAYAHQDLPFERLVEALQPQRDLSLSPLFQVFFGLQFSPPTPQGALPHATAGSADALPDLSLHELGLDNLGTRFDLEMHVLEAADGWRVAVSFDADLFDGTTIERLLRRYRTLVEEVVRDPSTKIRELVLASAPERHQTLVEWNAPRHSGAVTAGVHELFAARAGRTPDALAVVWQEAALSYAELDARTDRLASHLRRLGVGPEVRVGLFLDRSPELVVSLLAVWKAGGAYVPLDPAYPRQRLAFMLEDARISVLLTAAAQLERLPDHAARLVVLDRDHPPAGGKAGPPATPGGLAYVIYTSGSTGRPKGVQIEHRALTGFLAAMDRRVGLDAADVLLAVTTLSFDIAGLELCWPLVHGARVVLVPRSVAGDGAALAASLEAHRPSVMQATPATWRMLTTDGALPAGRLRVLCGGESLPRDLAGRLGSTAAAAWNLYGPTEATIWSTAWRFTGAPERVLLGQPLDNTAVYLLDEGFGPALPGTFGEVFLGGTGLARGYLRRPGLTAERFVPDPFAGGPPGARLYRTGDVARHLPDGNLEFRGRVDQQVKVRGHRIELGEIEALLGAHPAVVACAVVARRQALGDLVAYVVAEGPSPPPEVWRRHLGEQLPEYMIPALFVELEALPLLPNGKVDRSALDSLEVVLPEDRGAPPRTPEEELVAGIWCEVLGRDAEISRDSSFFELGGHSLSATQVVSRLRAVFAVELAVRALFEAPTVATLAQRIQAAQRGAQPPVAPPVAGLAGQGPAELSYAQKRLWFLDQLEPAGASYNIPAALLLSGKLAPEALQQALEELVRRHAVLRTRFVSHQGSPRQQSDPPGRWRLPRLELGGLAARDRESELQRLLRREARRPFDLGRGPLLRAVLLRLGRRRHVLFFNHHHIISDGWSMGILLRELAALYPAFRAGEPSPLADPGIRYADFAVWQRRWLSGPVLEQQVDYWRRELRDAPPLELPADRPRPPVTSPRGALLPLRLGGDLAERLRALSRRRNATLFMTLLAAWKTLLYRLSGQSDLSVGTAIANRGRREIEDLVGFFVNTLVLRSELGGERSFSALLAQVREKALGAYAHQDLPFEHLVDELEVERDLSRTPLFQVMFVLQNVPLDELELPDLTVRPLAAETASAKFDLTLSLAEVGDGFAGTLEYAVALYDATTAGRMVRRYERLLRSIVEDPDRRLDRLALLAAAERHQLLAEWNEPERSGSLPIARRFAAQAELFADAVAVVDGDEALSYAELAARTGRLAGELRRAGVGADVRVGIAVDRSPAMVVAVLAVLEAGGAYVPLDPSYPRQRLAFMAADAGLAVLLTESATRGRLPADAARRVILLDRQNSHPAADPPAAGADARALAYVLYTSGSTGRPKGVAMPRGGLRDLLSWQAARSALARPRTLQFASLAFDVSFQEILSTLGTGGCLVLVPEEVRRDPPELARVLDRQRVERLFLPFVALQRLAEAATGDGAAPGALREVFTAGEQLRTTEEIRRFCRRSECSLENQYGPSEAHVVTAHRLGPSPRSWRSLPPIGRALPHARVYNLDRSLRPVPVGVVGELYLAGPALSRGYLERPGLTARSYLPETSAARPGSRMYRTGDRVRFSAYGELEFLGRIGHQLKVRGYRVEPGEVEVVLAQHPAVRSCVVVASGELPSAAELVAFVVAADAAAPIGELRSHLAARLPEYMVPSAFVFAESLPLTPSGKVDRAALGRQALAAPRRRGLREPLVAPRSQMEALVAGVWSQVLGHQDPIGVDDNFFELGGHSLLATQVMSRLRGAFASELPLRILFENPTVEGLAAAIERRRAAASEGGEPAVPRLAARRRQGDPEASFAQQRLWFLDRLAPGSAFYNMASALRLEGRLDAGALERTFAEVVRRHQTLRTTFDSRNGRLVQVIHRIHGGPDGGWRLPLVDLSRLDRHQRTAAARREAGAEAARPFDLGRGPLLRTRLLRLDREDHVLLVTMHHVISDGWSIGVLIRELGTLYGAFRSAQRSPLPELEVQYADFAEWQRSWLRGPVLEAQLGYWRRQLAGVPALDLPTDRPRPPVQSFRGDTRPARLPAELRAALARLAGERSATLYMTLLAAFEILLHRYSGQRDFPLGTGIAGRTHAALEKLIGFFVNTLVIRADFAEAASFEEVLRRLREVVLFAYDHQDLPFEHLVDELGIERDASRMPLVQVVLVLLNMPLPELVLGDLRLSSWSLPSGTSKFDLTVMMIESPAGIQADFEFATDLFDGTTIDRMTRHFEILLGGIAADPEAPVGELPMLADAERHQLFVEWNAVGPAPLRAGAEPSFRELFAAQVERLPETVAVTCGPRHLTYAELDARAQRLAGELRALGAGPDQRVGILLERSPAMVVAVLGILEAGGAYTPLDPGSPRKRLAALAADAPMTVLVTSSALADRLPEDGARRILIDESRPPAAGPPAAGPAPETAPDNLAYVLYTSGSTGKPKGVMVSHRQLAHYLAECRRLYPLAGEVPVHSPLAFDLTVTSLLAPLAGGGRVNLLPEDAALDALVETLRSGRELSLLKLTPTHLEALAGLLPPPEPASEVRALILGGEALQWRSLDFWRARSPTTRLFNEYGPTETVVGCAIYEAAPGTRRGGGSVPIGRPVRGTRLHALDRRLGLVPAGVIGELFIGGPGVARGYLARPAMTAERFVPDLFGAPGGRLYRSGDLVRYLPGGNLAFLGRLDTQVKVRGFRIELGEIETVLAGHPRVQESVVVARESEPDAAKELVAHVVASAEGRRDGTAEADRIAEWRTLYEDTYDQPPPTGEASLNIAGWKSSYTGELIPAAEMRDWRDRTVERIRGLGGVRIWEIGCGTGLLLLRLAPHCSRYLATDFSAAALATLRPQVAARGLDQVTLARRSAAEHDAVAPASFDAVVLNSVVQYFPDETYLRTVLEGAVEATVPGGAVFVGDVRSLPLLEAFRTSVELHRAPQLAPADLRQRLRAAVDGEQELVLDAEYFRALAGELPGVTQVEVELKRGRDGNEMTRYRYDVALWTGEAAPPVTPAASLAWGAEVGDAAALERWLRRRRPPCVEVLGVPNARVEADLAAWQELAEGTERPLARTAAVDPEALWALGERLGYGVRVTLSRRHGAGSMDVLFEPAATGRPRPWVPGGPQTIGRLANNPLRAVQVQRLSAAWRAFLGERLPDYMVPSSFAVHEALPRTPSGKVDRAALGRAALPAERDRRRTAGYVAPRTEVERRLAVIWAEVLGRGPEDVGAGDNFFDLGGHSLLATQVVSRLRQELGIELLVRTLFEHQTLAALAAAVDEALRAGAVPTAPPLVALQRQEEELSFAQQRLWFLDRLIPGSTVYNMPAAVRLRGRLDAAALKRTCGEIVRRHQALRTAFASRDDRPVQVIAEAAPWSLPVVSLASLPPPRRRRAARRLAEAEARRPFDLSRAPLLRTCLLHLDREDHVLLLTTHHIVCDGWSVGLLLRELGTLYEAFRTARPSPLAELAVQYADYARWQRRWLTADDDAGGAVIETQLAYWRRRLEDLPVLELPADRPRPPVESLRGARRALRLPAELTARLKALGREQGATLFMTLLTAFEVLLHRLSGQQDFAVGTPVAGRRHPAVEDLVGFFVNTLVLRADVAGQPSFRQLLARLRGTTLEAQDHQDVPFERLVDELAVERDLSRTPLFQVMFALQNVPEAELRLTGLEIEPLAIATATTGFELALSFAEDGGAVAGAFEYATDLYDATTIARMAGHFERLTRSLAEDPERRLGELELLTAGERHQLLREQHATRRADASRWAPVHTLFAARAARAPDALAVVEEGSSGPGRALSYAELNARADRLADRLRYRGTGPDVPVGLCVERSLEMYVAVWAILKAGGAYVPLAPDLPRQRLGAMVRDLAIDLVVTQRSLQRTAGELGCSLIQIEDQGETGPPPAGRELRAGHLAYVIFTSGSTGVPKGVGVSHGALADRLTAMADLFGTGPEDRQLQFLSLSFDAWGEEFYPILGYGATLILLRDSGDLTPQALLERCGDLRVTKFNVPPSYWHRLVDDLAAADRSLPGSLRLFVSGGEASSPQKLRALARRGRGSLRFFNAYGPTEATIVTHALEIPFARAREERRERIPVGRPLPGVRAYVLDRRGRPLPAGVPGGLYLAGEGVARGYLARAAMTARRFVPDPFHAGARMYRTGDLARHLPNGTLDFLGRLDTQVKVRGFRVELGEIEEALGGHPDVRAACVVASEARQGELVAHVVTAAAAPQPRGLREYLAAKLPAYMIPAHFVVHESLPLLASGKVDRAALGRQPLPATTAERDAEVPRTPHEELVAGIWCEVLERQRVDRQSSFFELGGHSLNATQVISRLRRTFGVELAVRELFEAPTVTALAQRVQAAQRLDPERMPPLRRTADERHHPLSFAQERLWFLDRLQPGSSLYNVPAALSLTGPLRIPALRLAFEEIVRRHGVLRTRFVQREGQPRQVTAPAGEWTLPVVDLAGLESGSDQALRLARCEARRPFDLERDLLLRTTLLRLGGDTPGHVLLVNMHHIVSDGWSVGILVRELAALYAAFREGRPSPLADLPVRYTDFAVWQRRWLRGKVLDEQLEYWRSRLAGASTVELATDRPRPPVMSYRGALQSLRLPPHLVAGLHRLSRRHQATLFMTLHAAFLVLLHRLSRQRDLCVGTAVANRGVPEIEDLIGFFVNTLVLRTPWEEGSFAELLARVREVDLGAYAHQDLPFEQLVDRLEVERDLSRTPLFQVMFMLQNAPPGELRLPEMSVEPLAIEAKTAQFDLTLSLAEGAGALGGTFEYATDLYDGTTIARTAKLFAGMLGELVAAPERPLAELALLDAAARHQLVVEWNEPGAPDHEPVLARFTAQAARAPDAVAVVDRSASPEAVLSYGELDQRAERLARRLRQLGIGPEARVGIFLAPSLAMVVSLLGVFKAGGAYVPLDPSYPHDRLAFMAEDARLALVLTESRLAPSLPDRAVHRVLVDQDWSAIVGHGGEAAVAATATAGLAYVIYTSGSTGRPKGVQIEHRALASFLSAMDRRVGLDAGDALLAVTTLSFDIAGLELFWPLVRGARVELVPRSVASDGPALAACLGASRATVMQATPATWRMLLTASEPPLAGLRVLCGGEALAADLARELDSRAAAAWNLYGPTEATIWSAAWPVRSPRRVSLGRPLDNTGAHVLGAGLETVPLGAVGELLLTGAGLARGYLERPGLTAERFLPDPFASRPGGRLYRTGDLTRYLPSGELEFLGRGDQQVKVRGHRIELGEIEAVLAGHPTVRSCAVVAHAGPPARLVAYVVAEASSPATEAWRGHLRARLPEYMVPALFVELEALPLLPNGKVDRAGLVRRELPALGRAAAGSYLAPRNERELLLVQIWEDLLGLRPVGVRQSFFDLGGHSLLAVQLAARVEARSGKPLPLTTLFQAPTIAELAERLGEDGGPAAPQVAALQPKGSGPPFFCVHPAGGDVLCYYQLARLLGDERPFYGVRATGIEGGEPPHDSVEEMAEHHLAALRAVQGEGPYHLGGWSAGGLVAFEMALQLVHRGEEVASLVLLDAGVTADDPHLTPPSDAAEILAVLAQEMGLTLTAEELGPLSEDEQLSRLAQAAAGAEIFPAASAEKTMGRLWRVFRAALAATRNYLPARKYPGRLTLVRATELPADLSAESFASRPDNGWPRFVTGPVDVLRVAATHNDLLLEPHVEKVAAALAKAWAAPSAVRAEQGRREPVQLDG